MKTNLTNNNFISGVLSNSLNGRYNLPLYQNGLAYSTNFNLGYEGGLQRREGFRYEETTQEAVYMEFRFNEIPSYLIEFAKDGKIYFLTYDKNQSLGYILDSENKRYSIASPYTFEQAQTICRNKHYAQKDDYIYITHIDVKPKVLKRLTSSTFSITDVTFSGTNPFNETNGYPNCCCFYENRLFYAGLKNEATYLYGSDVGKYDTFTIVGGSDNDLDGFKFDLTEFNQRINNLFSAENSLLAISSEGIIPINTGSTEASLTKLNILAKKSIEDGGNGSKPIKVDNVCIYIDFTSRKTRVFSYDLMTEKFIAPNLNTACMDLTENGLKYTVSKKDDYNFFYILKNDGTLLIAEYIASENINGWSLIRLANDIKVNEVVSLPRGDGFEDLIVNVSHNGKYYICVLDDIIKFTDKENFFTGDKTNDELRYKRYQNEELTNCNYLDLSQKLYYLYDHTATYNKSTNKITSLDNVFEEDNIGNNIVFSSIDGSAYAVYKIVNYISEKEVEVELLTENSEETSNYWYITFNTIEGLDIYNNTVVSVVADGGYLGDFLVENNSLNLGKEVSVVTVGYKYTSIAKSLNLGFDFNGITTQITNKNIYEFTFRLNYSAGGKFGTDRYNLIPIHDFNASGNFNQPPLLINGDKKLKNLDGWNNEKNYYIVQDEPLPFNLSMITYGMISNND